MNWKLTKPVRLSPLEAFAEKEIPTGLAPILTMGRQPDPWWGLCPSRGHSVIKSTTNQKKDKISVNSCSSYRESGVEGLVSDIPAGTFYPDTSDLTPATHLHSLTWLPHIFTSSSTLFRGHCPLSTFPHVCLNRGIASLSMRILPKGVFSARKRLSSCSDPLVSDPQITTVCMLIRLQRRQTKKAASLSRVWQGIHQK